MTWWRPWTGCGWNARGTPGTHQSLAPHLLEEPCEALDALESGDEQAFCDELGDVLLQVVFHVRVAAERADGYAIGDVADGIVAKLVRRRPHVQRQAAWTGAPDDLASLQEDRALTGADGDIGRELFRLVTKAREVRRDPEMELRAAARCYRDLVRIWGRS